MVHLSNRQDLINTKSISLPMGRISGYLVSLVQLEQNQILTSRLFLKLLSLIYFAAFLSLTVQITGLAGSDGILPFQELQEQASRQLGSLAWLYIPTLFWFTSSDLALQGATVLGCIFSITLFFNIRPQFSLIILFILYLSLAKAGQLFLNFQWDYLLLESGFLAIFLVNGPTRLIVLLYHWLLFRLRFMSGVGKLASGDPSWSGLTALKHYFETQPLPHIGSWFAHQLPEWILQAGVLLTFFSELLVPFFIFLPRRFRLFAAAVTIVMQLLIIATSNHNFINILTIALCLFLLDDDLLRRFLPRSLQRFANIQTIRPGRTKTLLSTLAALLIFSSSLPLLITMTTGIDAPASVTHWTRLVRRFGIGNAYHIFPTMQTERIELQIEGSLDGQEWQTYTLPWQPGALDRKPAFIIPHQPRLDWMIWFIPAQQQHSAYWFNRFMQQLSQGSPQVTALLESNPFADQPPLFLRVSAYRYHFTTMEERKQNGNWWKREYIGLFPQIEPRRP